MYKVSAIVCVSPSGGIGDAEGKLLYYNTNDLAFFSGFTQGKVLIVGYNTARTLPKLANRCVLEDFRDVEFDLCWIARSNQSDVVVIGGSATYTKYAPQIEELYVTRMKEESSKEATAFFDIEDFKHLKSKSVVYKNNEFQIERWV
jgi:dihydrofolate reductase